MRKGVGGTGCFESGKTDLTVYCPDLDGNYVKVSGIWWWVVRDILEMRRWMLSGRVKESCQGE